MCNVHAITQLFTMETIKYKNRQINIISYLISSLLSWFSSVHVAVITISRHEHTKVPLTAQQSIAS